MENEPNGPLVGYTCPNCGFDTDETNCDSCNAIVKWNDYDKDSAYCTGCGTSVYTITCRECGYKFDI